MYELARLNCDMSPQSELKKNPTTEKPDLFQVEAEPRSRLN